MRLYITNVTVEVRHWASDAREAYARGDGFMEDLVAAVHEDHVRTESVSSAQSTSPTITSKAEEQLRLFDPETLAPFPEEADDLHTF